MTYLVKKQLFITQDLENREIWICLNVLISIKQPKQQNALGSFTILS